MVLPGNRPAPLPMNLLKINEHNMVNLDQVSNIMFSPQTHGHDAKISFVFPLKDKELVFFGAPAENAWMTLHDATPAEAT